MGKQLPVVGLGMLLAWQAAAGAQGVAGPQDQPRNDRFNPGTLRSTLVVPETRVERFRRRAATRAGAAGRVRSESTLRANC